MRKTLDIEEFKLGVWFKLVILEDVRSESSLFEYLLGLKISKSKRAAGVGTWQGGEVVLIPSLSGACSSIWFEFVPGSSYPPEIQHWRCAKWCSKLFGKSRRRTSKKTSPLTARLGLLNLFGNSRCSFSWTSSMSRFIWAPLNILLELFSTAEHQISFYLIWRYWWPKTLWSEAFIFSMQSMRVAAMKLIND